MSEEMKQGTRSLKRKRFTGRTVTITVGSNAERFSIHEDILQERSTFFKAALQKYWNEGATGNIELPDDDPDAVSAYFEWLYSATIASKAAQSQNTPGKDAACAEYEHLARMYVLGEKIQDNEFCNAVISAFTLRMGAPGADGRYWYPTTKAVSIIYEGTPEGSSARRLFIDMHTGHGNEEWIEFGGEPEHPLFLRDLAKSFLRGRAQPPFKDQYSNRHKWFKEA